MCIHNITCTLFDTVCVCVRERVCVCVCVYICVCVYSLLLPIFGLSNGLVRVG